MSPAREPGDRPETSRNAAEGSSVAGVHRSSPTNGFPPRSTEGGNSMPQAVKARISMSGIPPAHRGGAILVSFGSVMALTRLGHLDFGVHVHDMSWAIFVLAGAFLRDARFFFA